MKYLLLACVLMLSFGAMAATTPWTSYPTTNLFGDTDTFIIGNGVTNLTMVGSGLKAVTQGQINTSSNLVFGNALSQINTTSNSVVGTSQTAINTSSNSVVGTAQTIANTTSNLLNTQINTSSNLTFGNALTQINTTSNILQGEITSGGVTLVQLNTTSNLVYGNALTQINTTSNSLNTLVNTSSNLNFANTITSINTSSNLVYGNGVSQINTTSNLLNTLVNTSSNLVYGNALSQINTTSNSVVGTSQTAINTSSNAVLGNAQTAINTTSNLLSIPNVLGIVTNTAAGVHGVSVAVPGTWIAAGTIPITALGNTFMPLTNAVAFSNATGVPTPGKALVIAPGGTNSYGAVLLNETNWPTGGGSQTPWTSDINAGQFALTNLNALTVSNSVGMLTVNSNSATVWSNLLTTTFARISTNSSLHLGSNAVETVVIKGIDGSILASNITLNTSATLASNFFGGISFLASNAAPASTVSPSGLNSITMNQRWTNNFNRLADLEIQARFTDSATGDPGLGFTNTTTGQTWTNSPVSFAIIGTSTITIVIPDISPNNFGSFSNYSGTGASVTFLQSWWHLK